ncbi:MAG: hypothetical protein FDX18_11240 [Chlorobium sp.]|nr:MAG: hypothetical protein FDX18_11240 [Chlorobium sp.]
MNGEPVGVWKITPTGLSEFAYVDSWLASSIARPISLFMPLRKEKYSGDLVSSWFDNLLPNNDVIRRRIRDRFAIAV